MRKRERLEKEGDGGRGDKGEGRESDVRQKHFQLLPKPAFITALIKDPVHNACLAQEKSAHQKDHASQGAFERCHSEGIRRYEEEKRRGKEKLKPLNSDKDCDDELRLFV
jgi:hypothetical protein